MNPSALPIQCLLRLLLFNYEPCAKLSPNTIRESSEVGARKAALEVARVEMIGHIENFHTQLQPVFFPFAWQAQILHHLQVK